MAKRSSSSTLRPGVCFAGVEVYFRVTNPWGHRVGFVEKVLMTDSHFCPPPAPQKAFLTEELVCKTSGLATDFFKMDDGREP